MSSSTVSVVENNQVEIRRIFSPAFLLFKKYGTPDVIRGYETGQPVSEIGQELIGLGLVWQWRELQDCPYCRRRIGSALSFRNYFERSGFNPTAALHECTACGSPLATPVLLFEIVKLKTQIPPGIQGEPHSALRH